jgi:L-alanine-DL-glutamate epimerase-like enolase superfamily enzyme
VRFQQEGFPAIKVKLGESLEKDVERIRSIREGVGSQIPLRIDANQGWQSADEAIAVLQALAPYNIEHCEEPIARWRFMELSRVSAASPIPIMADAILNAVSSDMPRTVIPYRLPVMFIKIDISSSVKSTDWVRPVSIVT